MASEILASLQLGTFAGIQPTKVTSNEICGRWVSTASWTPGNQMSDFAASFSLNSVGPPSINAICTSYTTSQTVNTINFNPSAGCIYIPKTGRYTINVVGQGATNITTTIGFQFFLYLKSAPAWSATGQTAVTSQSASSAQNAISAVTLQYSPWSQGSVQNSLTWSGNLVATTLLGIGVYSSSSSVSFPQNGLIVQAQLDYPLNL